MSVLVNIGERYYDWLSAAKVLIKSVIIKGIGRNPFTEPESSTFVDKIKGVVFEDLNECIIKFDDAKLRPKYNPCNTQKSIIAPFPTNYLTSSRRVREITNYEKEVVQLTEIRQPLKRLRNVYILILAGYC